MMPKTRHVACFRQPIRSESGGRPAQLGTFGINPVALTEAYNALFPNGTDWFELTEDIVPGLEEILSLQTASSIWPDLTVIRSSGRPVSGHWHGDWPAQSRNAGSRKCSGHQRGYWCQNRPRGDRRHGGVQEHWRGIGPKSVKPADLDLLDAVGVYVKQAHVGRDLIIQVAQPEGVLIHSPGPPFCRLRSEMSLPMQ